MAKTRTGRKRMKLTKKTDDKETIEADKSRWGDLDYDLLEQILALLPVTHLIRSVSLVCRHWNLGCLTALFCKDYETLDLSPLKTLLGHPFERDKEVQRALKFVLNWDWKKMESVRRLILAPRPYLIDTHLALLAKRLPKLKKLVLPEESYNITLKGFSRIIKSWKELEELSVGPLGHSYSHLLFQTLGRSCKNLTTLHTFGSFTREIALSRFSFILDEQKATVMTENPLKLRTLTIDEKYLHKSGFWTLLSESKNLVELNLNRCCGEVDSPISFPTYPMLTTKLIFLKNEISTVIKSSKLKNCLEWYIASSLADQVIRYTTQELVNHLWSGDVVEIELDILVGYD